MRRRAYRPRGLATSRLTEPAHRSVIPSRRSPWATCSARGRSGDDRCLIGSVKTNLGHLESASGVAGLIKAALVLQRGSVPPSLNFETPNPEISFDALKLEVATILQPLTPSNGAGPVAAVNSFGFGGANAHVVLEATPAAEEIRPNPGPKTERPFVLPVSARDESALRDSAKAFRERLAAGDFELADFCYSAGARKENHSEQLVVAGQEARQLVERLDTWLDDGDSATDGIIISGTRRERSGPVVFVYTGQGPQWWAMGRQLMEREPLVDRTIRRIDELMSPLAGWSVIDELTRPEHESRIDRTAIAQPAIFALQVALTELWKSWGVEPAAAAGHSIGEVAAAFCAGIFSLEDAVRIVHQRSRLQESTGGGGRMLAAGVSAAEARRLIGGRTEQVELTAINSPDLVTLAGDARLLEELAEALETEGRFVRWLPVDYAFHTRRMDPIRDELIAELAGIQPRPGTIPFVSTVTGNVIGGEKLDADYWWRNVRRPVLFASAVSRLGEKGYQTFLEIGPHPSLRISLTQCLPSTGKSGAVFHSLRREADDWEEILSQLAGLHLAGVPVDWASVNRSAGNLVRLPNYPWQYRTHWLDEGEMAERLLPEPHPFLGKRIPAAKPLWRGDLDPNRFRFLRDHRIWNSLVFPASGYGEIGLALAKVMFPGTACVVENLESVKALFVSENDLRILQIAFEPADSSFAVYSAPRAGDDWELNARGRLLKLSKEAIEPEPANLEKIRSRLTGVIGHEQFYAEFHAIGYQFGPEFCRIENVWRTEGEALAELPVPETNEETEAGFRFHPALLDACFQASRGVQCLPPGAIPADYLFLPESIRRIQFYADQLPARLWAHARQTDDDDSAITADIFVYDDEGRRVADILGFRATRMELKRPGAGIDDFLYQSKWIPAEIPREETEAGDSLSDPGHYLILTDRGGIADALTERIESAGGTAIQVRAGREFKEASTVCFTIPADSESDLSRVFHAVAGDGRPSFSIVHCWSLDSPGVEAVDAAGLWKSQRYGVKSVLTLCQALHTCELEIAPRVYFVTRDTHAPAAGEDLVPGLASAPLRGFARVANNEHAENRWTTIDLGPEPEETMAGRIFDEIAAEADDLEVAYRGGARFVHELNRAMLESLPKRTQKRIGSPPDRDPLPFRVETDRPGVLANLSLNETRRREPDPNEVEIGIHAGGVNFRDVMKALGIYPGNPVDLLWFGDDFAGEVLRVGSRVTDFQPGDRVAGLAPGCFRSHVTVDHRLVLPLPLAMSFEEAATLPTVFLTAHHALVHLGRMKAGEKILIHAGSGGVGQAAIQVAQHLGLEIFATAGSPEKRRLMSDLGVPYVMDSRTFEFADQIMEITGGEGVDAVLNSLAGPFIPKSLSVLAPFGRFLEIGKNRRLRKIENRPRFAQGQHRLLRHRSGSAVGETPGTNRHRICRTLRTFRRRKAPATAALGLSRFRMRRRLPFHRPAQTHWQGSPFFR